MKETSENGDEIQKVRKLKYQDQIDRIAVEGRFGVAKRKYGLGLIKANLQATSETEIVLAIFTMNLDKICSEEMNRIKAQYKVSYNMAG